MLRTYLLRQGFALGTLLAILVSGLSLAWAEQGVPRGSALIVPIGGTVRLQMQSKKPIKTVDNPKDSVINIRTVVGDPTTVLIIGQQPDVTRIELTDSDDQKETYEVIVQLDVEYLKTQIRRAVPTANVTPIPSSNNAIILTGTVAGAEDIGVIRRVAQCLGAVQVIDAMRVGGVKQVHLDVVVLSVNQNRTGFSGSDAITFKTILDAIYPRGRFRDNPDINWTSGPVDSPFQFAVVNNGPRLLDHVEVLKKLGVVKCIAQPSLVTLSGRPATFLVGGDQAVPVVGGIGGATGVSFEPFGAQVIFLPIVLGNGKIHMEIAPSITALDPQFGTILTGAGVIPGRSRTCANTTVQLEPDQTFLIGGLTQCDFSMDARWSFLEGVPFVGALLRTWIMQAQAEDMLILVTPHVVDSEDCQQVTRTPPEPESGIIRTSIPAYKTSPSLDIVLCAHSEKEKPKATVEAKIEEVLRKLEQIEKRLDERRKPPEENRCPKGDKPPEGTE